MAEPGETIPATGAAGGAAHEARGRPAPPGHAPVPVAHPSGPGRRWSAPGRFRVGLRHLFYGRRPPSVAFQVGLLALDLAAVGCFLASAFAHDAPWLRSVDLLL